MNPVYLFLTLHAFFVCPCLEFRVLLLSLLTLFYHVRNMESGTPCSRRLVVLLCFYFLLVVRFHGTRLTAARVQRKKIEKQNKRRKKKTTDTHNQKAYRTGS